MKSYNEISVETKALEQEVNEAEAEIIALNERKRNLWHNDKTAYSKYKLSPQAEADAEVKDRLCQLIANNKIAIAILDNNAKVALSRHVLPVALEILDKYNGKSYGEKTQAKISDEMYARTGYRMYISRSPYSFKPLRIWADGGLYKPDYDLEYNKIFADGSIGGFLTKDNKIDTGNCDNVKLWEVDEYVEDVHARVAELNAAEAKIHEAEETLRKLNRAYNDLAVGHIERMSFI